MGTDNTSHEDSSKSTYASQQVETTSKGTWTSTIEMRRSSSSLSIFHHSTEDLSMDAHQQYEKYHQELLILLEHTKGLVGCLHKDLMSTLHPSSILVPEDTLEFALKTGEHGVIGYNGKDNMNDFFYDTGRHLDRLVHRLLNPQCRILVTGDVNAGKSTFLNALFRAEIFPTDQQPCTSAFCEFVASYQNTGNVEDMSCTEIKEHRMKISVHGITNMESYDPGDSNTFSLLTLQEMHGAMKQEQCPFVWFKIQRSLPLVLEHSSNTLTNTPCNHVPWTFIDSPGLNHDRIQTMALFASQEDIDVVILVIHAANHLTLSCKEFLQASSKEKAYIFIIVNRMDEIDQPERCKRLILHQICQILPRTFERAQDLIHFTSSKDRLLDKDIASNSRYSKPAFNALQISLKKFVHTERIQSKLLPVKTYLQNLYAELLIITSKTLSSIESSLKGLEQTIGCEGPLLDRLSTLEIQLLEEFDKLNDKYTNDILQYCYKQLFEFQSNFHTELAKIPWPGVLYSLGYIKELNACMNNMLCDQLESCEKFSYTMSIDGCEKIADLAKSKAPGVFQSLEIHNEALDLSKVPRSRSYSIHFRASFFELLDFRSIIAMWKQRISSIGIGGTALFIGGAPILHLLGRVGIFANSFIPLISHGNMKLYQRSDLCMPESPLQAVCNTLQSISTPHVLPHKRTIFITLAVCSLIGTLIYLFCSDLQAILLNRSRQLFEDRLIQESWIYQQSLRIANIGQKHLRNHIWHYQSIFHQILIEKHQRHQERIQKRSFLLRKFDIHRSYQQNFQTLMQRNETLCQVNQSM
jgi:GTP-binding protein EngB required for normal cell division